jgi:hypothetical protein
MIANNNRPIEQVEKLVKRQHIVVLMVKLRYMWGPIP